MKKPDNLVDIESPSAEKKGGREKSLKFVGNEDVISAYLAEIKHIKPLGLEEERELALRTQQGDKAAMHALVQANLKFVVAVCRNYQHQGLPFGDLINEGNLGLIRAAQRFDPGMNFKFISYAVWWIRQGILTALAEQSRVLRIAPGKVTVFQKIGRANQKLEQQLGRPPSQEEVADHMGISQTELTECLQLASNPVSITQTFQDEDDNALENILEDKESDRTDKAARQHRLKETMEDLVGTLEEREADILRLYYGLGRQSTLTLEEIAQRFGLTRERVRQLKARALERLRHPSRIPRLNQFRD